MLTSASWLLMIYDSITPNLGFPNSSVGKACNAGDPCSSIPGLGRSPEEGKGYPLQYPGLENSMDCIVCGVAKSWTRLSNFNFILFKAEINKEINTCGGFPRGSAGQESSCNLGDLGLTWVGKIPWGRERLPTPVSWPGEFHGLYSQSTGSLRVGHYWATFTSVSYTRGLPW